MEVVFLAGKEEISFPYLEFKDTFFYALASKYKLISYSVEMLGNNKEALNLRRKAKLDDATYKKLLNYPLDKDILEFIDKIILPLDKKERIKAKLIPLILALDDLAYLEDLKAFLEPYKRENLDLIIYLKEC